MGLLELEGIARRDAVAVVSIRRADLGLLELLPSFGSQSSPRFQSAGRIWGFWNPQTNLSQKFAALQFQSAGRIWGFWNGNDLARPVVWLGSFNPPGGFGAFGTHETSGGAMPACLFQSAGRIWGFWNPLTTHAPTRSSRVSIRRADLGLLEHGSEGTYGNNSAVSIRRADLGLLELTPFLDHNIYMLLFQSAGRIWGFWNSTTASPE
ncbi:hypothetical protein OSCT_0322 [Oscillochloris trichoides DG-6]|uniref:Uncharacterized protein n=1 Tax=Oscillochloris trichoides DG-6 TaxID=765420 RepID=E1IAH1_9CHLR|nr:hypothetical protein OSCT_0322 [Oscillochloris trichoides DG-6]